MDSRVCGLCGEHENACGGVLGLFVGPISGVGDASCWVHRLCALWSPEVGLHGHEFCTTAVLCFQLMQNLPRMCMKAAEHVLLLH